MLNPLEQARSTARLLQLRAPLLSGSLSPIEQARATAESIELHGALLDALTESTPNHLNALELMRFSAELLTVRANLEAGKLSPIEQVRASARGLELRGLLGSARRPQRRRQAEPANTMRLLVTGTIAQKNGGLLVTGNSLALSAYATAYMDQAKFTMTADGLLFTKAQARAAKALPITQEILPSGAVLYTYTDPDGVSVAYKGDISGIARDLANLKSLMAQKWGPVKFRTVFGEDAAPADVEAYQEELAAIAQRKQGSLDEAAQALVNQQLAQEQEQARIQAEAAETARIVAQNQADDQAEFDRTIGAGKADNPLYQAYLDTLEELPTKSSNAGFLGWAGIRAGEFERLSKGRISADRAGHLAYVRQWADDHLSERVKATKAAEPVATITGTGTQFVEPGVLAEPPEVGAVPVYGSRREFLVVHDGLMVADETKHAAIVHAYGKTGPAVVRAYAREYNGGRRWIMPGEKIEPIEADQDPEPPAAQHEIVEYTTKSTGKVLRGIIRTDLSLAEAKAIDPHTWRMNGGYFIREKYLTGDTAHIQAAPAPVVLSPEQQVEKAATDERLAEERRQKALGSQVEKLRSVANKAIEGGEAGMGQDRNTNTARRAGMAASAIAKASANKADGQTLNNIADAIEVGAGGLLTKLSSRAQLEELQRALRLAQYETDRRLSYGEQLKRKGRPFDEEDLKNVVMPSQVTWASRFNDAAKIIAKKSPTGNARLIAALYKMGARAERFTMNPEDAAITRKAHDVLRGLREGYTLQDPVESLARQERLARMGITDASTLREAARELLPMMAAKTEESAVKKAERAIIGQKVGIDFFPTPANVAQRMARLAGIAKGMRVLEPSAGNGNLADAAKAAGGEVDVIEISSQLRDILTAKGYTVVDHDFDGFTPEQPYQAILMNPPFSARKDASHIMRAYGMLASGGHLVAIAGEGVFFGQDQKAVAFRTWLDTHNATVEKLDGGTFKDKELLAQTGANARLIVLKK
jgi:hypothetical protein